MDRTEAMKELNELLKNCQACERRNTPYSPRSHELRNNFCIKKCHDVGPRLREIGKQLEDITKIERAKKKGVSA
jgi:hypothetical protein